MNYAVDFRVVGPTSVACWKGREEPTKVVLKLGRGEERPTEVRRFLEQLGKDDVVFMALGGVGGPFAQQAYKRTGQVFRIPTFRIKDIREELGYEGKEENCLVIAHLAKIRSEGFYEMRPVDEAIVGLQVLVRKRQAVQQDARIPAELRLQQIARDTWLSESPEEDLAAWFKLQVEQHPLFRLAANLETELEEQIEAVVTKLPLYHEVFAPVDGIGPIIGARLIVGFIDIRLFPTPPKMLAYSGWHLRDGEVPRRRANKRANWNHDLQDALSKWQISMMMSRSPDSEWKRLYYERKERDRQRHPEPVVVGYTCFRCLKDYTPEEAKAQGGKCPRCGRRFKKKTLYTPGHLHRRALRFVTQQLVEHLWKEWRRFEGLSTTV